MNNTNLLESIIIEPQQTAKHCVIWLHGLGADGHDFVDLIPQLQLPLQHGIRFVFPHAPLRPVTINNRLTLRAWFDLYSLENLDQEDTEGLAASDALIQQLIEEALQRNIPANQIILAGFSQGGAMALHTALRYPQKLGGVLALSAYLPQMDALATEAHPSNQDTPIMMAHGTHDPVLPMLLGEKSYLSLQKLGYPIRWHAYPMAHEVCREEIEDIAKWLKQICL